MLCTFKHVDYFWLHAAPHPVFLKTLLALSIHKQKPHIFSAALAHSQSSFPAEASGELF